MGLSFVQPLMLEAGIVGKRSPGEARLDGLQGCNDWQKSSWWNKKILTQRRMESSQGDQVNQEFHSTGALG